MAAREQWSKLVEVCKRWKEKGSESHLFEVITLAPHESTVSPTCFARVTRCLIRPGLV